MRPCIEHHILPLLSETVDSELQSVEMKNKYRLQDVSEIMDKTFDKILTQLFAVDSGTAPESNDLSQDSFASEVQATKGAWIVERFIDQHKAESADIASHGKRMERTMDDMLDLLQSPYFESTLFEMLSESYSVNLRGFTQRQLHGEEGPFKGSEDQVYMLKVVTSIFVLQQNSVYTGQLRTLEFRDVQDSIDQFIKWIYFDREAADFEPLQIKDLIDAADRGGNEGLGLLDLLRNLGDGGQEEDMLAQIMNAIQAEQ